MTDEKFTPPDGMPGHQELKHRREQATGILSVRRIGVQPNTDLMLLQTITRLVRSRLGVTDAEFDYWFDLVAVEGLETVVEQSAPKNVIHLPGRDA